MIILYGHPESGHTCKVALTLELAGLPFEYRREYVFKPLPRLCCWLQEIRALPRWRGPQDLLAKPS